MSQRKGGQPEVRLGLAATGWEPQEVGDITVVVAAISQRRKVQKNERDLKRAPLRDTRRVEVLTAPSSQSDFGSFPLECHRPIGKAE